MTFSAKTEFIPANTAKALMILYAWPQVSWSVGSVVGWLVCSVGGLLVATKRE